MVAGGVYAGSIRGSSHVIISVKRFPDSENHSLGLFEFPKKSYVVTSVVEDGLERVVVFLWKRMSGPWY